MYTRERVLAPLATAISNIGFEVNEMRERAIEQRLVREVKLMGGIVPKFTSPGFDGVPDRIVLLPGGKMGFVELKAPGQIMRPLQVQRKRQLEGLGFLVYCVDGIEQIGGVLHEIAHQN